MPSAQERLKEDGAEEKNNDFSSEPSSRAYTPPLPPLATPEYVRYLQEQRRGDLDTETTPSQTASGNTSDSEFQPPSDSKNNNNNNINNNRQSFASAIEVEAGNKEDEMEKERRRNEDVTFAPIIGPDRNPSLSGSRANSHEDLVGLNTRAIMNAANERYKDQAQEAAMETQKRTYTEL